MAPPETSSPPPSASTALLPFLSSTKSRRGSLASITSRAGAGVDKDVLSQVLDDIHTEASRSETLTSFHDFDGEGGRSGAKELVSSGVSGLYNRLKQSVGSTTSLSTKDNKDRPKSSASKDSVDTTSLQSVSPTVTRSGTSSLARKSASDAIATNIGNVSDLRSVLNDRGCAGPTGGRSSNLQLHTADGETIPSFATGEAKRRGQPLTPNVQGREHRAPGTWVGNDRRTPANESFTAVLSRHEMPTDDRAEQTQIAPIHDGNGLNLEAAIDDSDYDIDPEDSLSASRAISSNRVCVTDSDVRKRDQAQDPGVSRPPQVGADRLESNAQRPPMVKVGVSHLPGFEPSRASSTTDGADTSSFYNSQVAARNPTLDPSPNINSALGRKRTSYKQPQPALQARISATHALSSPLHRKRRLLSKEFWMKDDNAKVCFSCGQSFSTFRRKHHCRICGQIFDAKCTMVLNGKWFRQPGTVRLCKPCEEMSFSSDDDSSIFSDEGDEYVRSPMLTSHSEHDEMVGQLDGSGFSRTDKEVMTPSIGIPASRRNRAAKSRSAVIEFDTQPALGRPSSSHSLKSQGRRPRSSSHRRRHSRPNPVRGPRAIIDDRGPFHQDAVGGTDRHHSLPTFHNDNIIDPDLAAYLSGEDSDEDDQPNIMSAVADGPAISPDNCERLGLGDIHASALKKGRSKTGDRGPVLSGGGAGAGDDEAIVHASKHLAKLVRSRNLSNGSMSYGRPSPGRSRSNLPLTAGDGGMDEQEETSPLLVPQQSHAKVMCSSTLYSLYSKERDDVELYPVSSEHVKKLLAQLLKDANIPSARAWEKALIPIIMHCTDDVEPDVQQGDDMDIRHYVKLKKVTGGRPGDTSYVSGVVFSKNVALKTMARSISDPRIAIVTFAIEYTRHEAHFMSLEPVIAQEQEYLENLVSRIAALRPNVLLVQKHVSGLALRLLEKAGITVAYNIKESVLAAVARVTQTIMIKSVDRLGTDPSHLGHCDNFEVKTYVSEGTRKTYIYLSGCDPDLGCTIVLRGGDTKTLRCIKRITEFMCYVAYNLKLENYLMRDEFVSIPHTAQSQIETHDDPSSWKNRNIPSLEEMKHSIRETMGHDVDNGESHFKYEALEMETRKRMLSASPFVIFMQPHILTQLRDMERRLSTYKMLRDEYAAADEEGEEEEEQSDIINNFKLVQPEMVHRSQASRDLPKAVREYLHAVHEAQFEKAKHTYELQERQWETFVNGDVNPFDPFSHQKIVVLYSTVSSITSAPCTGPELLGIEFYAGYNRVEPHHDEDIPFGQYVEDLCLSANTTCKDCNKKMCDHHRQYVHGYGQLSVSIQRQPAKMSGYANTILMWSTCRICRHETTVTPMSDHTWKYSFAKYLELSFWSSPLHPRAGLCKHDIHKDFLRCFGYQDMVVRFQYDPIDIYDIVVPRGRVTWKVEADLTVKNEQYSLFERRLEAFTDSVRKRLDTINIDTLDEKTTEEAVSLLEKLRQKIEDDHQELLAKLQRKYATSRYFEVIPLNRALRFMDEKAIEWDEEFNNFERDYFPSETDIRNIAALQLRNMFVESHPSTAASIASDVSDSEDGAEIARIIKSGVSRREAAEDVTPEKAQHVLSSVVEEHKTSNVEADQIEAIKRSNEGPQMNGSVLGREASPRQGQEEAVEREDVRHLDLAVPAHSPNHASPKDGISVTESFSISKHGTAESIEQGSETSSTQPKPLSSGLLERIEQIRSNRTAGGAEQEAVESRIPRLVDLKKRDANNQPGPPPLLRAQSHTGHPGHTPRRSVDMNYEHSLDAVVKGNSVDPAGELPPVEKRLADRLGVSRLASKVGRVAPSFIPRSIPQKSEESKILSSVSALARHFEQLSREFEKERLKERRQRAVKNRQIRANPLASSRPVVEVYQNATDAVGEKTSEQAQEEKDRNNDSFARQHMDDFVASSQPEDLPGEQDGKWSQSAQDDRKDIGPEQGSIIDTDIEGDTEVASVDLDHRVTRSRDVSDPASSMSPSFTSPTTTVPEMELGPDISIPEHKKNVWFKYLSEFWSKRSASGWSNLEYPLHNTEHVFEDSDIIVREDEPSSVIALSLACSDYHNKVQEFRSNPSRTPLTKHGHSHTQSHASVDSAEAHREAIEASLLSDTGTHMKYSFAHGQVKASCKIFYAESFDALRRKCCVADRFIESMSRCLKFDSKGGKTKSLFLRTLDNRFIIKSLQEVELKAFTKFAPDYFNFMSYTLFHGVPSVIAKMFGLFQVNIRNPATGVDFSYYLLVMENLFYERSPNRRFDLKGSMRNRKIESTGQADEVLLDENLVETIFESPLFVREHSRKLLQASVFNDTLWLCKQNVMDYSLMAGFDDSCKELVVGIIDCIRTYTWDKKLESWIKDRGKNKPTITSPKDYRNRFRVSMMQYVLQAPNCWHQFQERMHPKTLKEESGVGGTGAAAAAGSKEKENSIAEEDMPNPAAFIIK